MIEITDKEVFTTLPEEKRIHRLGTDVYFSRCTKLNGDTIGNFEEISIEDIPSQDSQDEL